jgi:hypothetical protein
LSSGENEIYPFLVNDFNFHLLESLPEADSFIYGIRKGDFSLRICACGVNVSSPAGVICSVDFIRFVWKHFGISYHIRYAFTIIPSTLKEGDPKLCLKYYRAGADGWNNSTHSALCVSEHRHVTLLHVVTTRMRL